MTIEIGIPIIETGSDKASLPAYGVLAGEVVEVNSDGVMVELVLPDRFPGGPAIPFKASWWSITEGKSTPPDEHSSQELWFVAQGSGRLKLGDQEMSIQASQVVYIPAHTPHQVTAISADLVVFSVWWQ